MASSPELRRGIRDVLPDVFRYLSPEAPVGEIAGAVAVRLERQGRPAVLREIISALWDLADTADVLLRLAPFSRRHRRGSP